jgi:hypothetical protein
LLTAGGVGKSLRFSTQMRRVRSQVTPGDNPAFAISSSPSALNPLHNGEGVSEIEADDSTALDQIEHRRDESAQTV